ncbi:TetR/AcrR family transcriptional regulator, partial [Burkholderia multivorans]
THAVMNAAAEESAAGRLDPKEATGYIVAVLLSAFAAD